MMLMVVVHCLKVAPSAAVLSSGHEKKSRVNEIHSAPAETRATKAGRYEMTSTRSKEEVISVCYSLLKA